MIAAERTEVSGLIMDNKRFSELQPDWMDIPGMVVTKAATLALYHTELSAFTSEVDGVGWQCDKDSCPLCGLLGS